ncbi:hypothetical protein EC957_006213 [Mortierella hygrophila]|uniref:Uncharacterized protein n=1 Tax=Mortierella hygrophila TaxID=979708 RepID=A0A9P6EZS7_9FUNG|nr:hypothetical protein EC957_006213 [Mortierella hygrophila]
MDYPPGDCQSMESMTADVEGVEEEELNWKFALEEMDVTLNKTLFPRSRSCLSSGAIETFEHAYRTVAAIAFDVTPDYATAVALIKHDDNDNSNDGSVFVQGYAFAAIALSIRYAVFRPFVAVVVVALVSYYKL